MIHWKFNTFPPGTPTDNLSTEGWAVSGSGGSDTSEMNTPVYTQVFGKDTTQGAASGISINNE